MTEEVFVLMLFNDYDCDWPSFLVQLPQTEHNQIIMMLLSVLSLYKSSGISSMVGSLTKKIHFDPKCVMGGWDYLVKSVFVFIDLFRSLSLLDSLSILRRKINPPS